MNLQQTIGRLSERYQVSADAVETLALALQRSGGRLAQFNHAELGGYGQWMPGMTQIGDMFNRPLLDRVENLCHDLSSALTGDKEGNAFPWSTASEESRRIDEASLEPMKPMEPMMGMRPMEPMQPMKDMASDKWWPESLGDSPNTAGGQNDIRYAYFASKNRLAVDRGGGKIRVYDTTGHDVSGVQQKQGSGGNGLVLTSEKGETDLDSLKQVSDAK